MDEGEAGQTVYTEDIQFKIHCSHSIFDEVTENKDGSLGFLATARGLLFAAHPSVPEIRVFHIKQMISAKENGEDIVVRKFPIPAAPINISCSCDGVMLAVNFILNGSGVLHIYNVKSFLSSQVQLMHDIRISAEENVYAHQLLWCPVFAAIICVILSNGGVCMYTLNENGTFEVTSLDKSNHVQCGCWSPKGKQIVFGFQNNILKQYKPNLTIVKAIECPNTTPLNAIAIYWLSTYQFAVIFDSNALHLHIINAPKGVKPSMTLFYDACFSNAGLGRHQFSLYHVQKWNLLLVTSARGIEIGVLKTVETGDTPKWTTLSLSGEARIEMPLANNVDDTFPIGFAFDSGSTHQVTIGEQTLPKMPMVHVLSTHGQLISYDFLNLENGAASIVTRSSTISNLPAEFKPLKKDDSSTTNDPVKDNQNEVSFNLNSNMITSTPAPTKDKPQSLFSSLAVADTAQAQANNQPQSAFASSTPTIQPQMPFASSGQTQNEINPLVQATAPQSLETQTKQPQTPEATQTDKNSVTFLKNDSELKQPLYTVPEDFKPPLEILKQTKELYEICGISEAEIESITKDIVVLSIQSFNDEIQQLRSKVDKVFREAVKPSFMKESLQRLYSLQQLMEQAKELELQKDVQKLLQSLEECYEMMKECRYRLEVNNDSASNFLHTVPHHDKIGERQLAKLQSSALRNETQLQYILQRIDTAWSEHQDTVRRQSKQEMHVPCLEGIYQRLTHLKVRVMKNRTDIDNIKFKLKQKGVKYVTTSSAQAKISDQTIASEKSFDSLVNSIKDVSIMEKKKPEQTRKLPKEKLKHLINLARQQTQTPVRKPQRPARELLKSEVILEYKERLERQAKERLQNQKEMEANKLKQIADAKQVPKPIKKEANIKAPIPILQSQSQQHSGVPKEGLTPFVALNAKPPLQPQPASSFVEVKVPVSGQNVNANLFSFGSGSSFVKPSHSSKDPGMSSGLSSVPSSFSFSNTSNTGAPFAFGQNKSSDIKPQQVPISFSAKVITSDADNKSFDKTGAKPSSMPSSSSAFGSLAANFGVSNFSSSIGNSTFSFGQTAKPTTSDPQPVICSTTTSLKTPAVVTTAVSSSSVPVKPMVVNFFGSSASATATTTTTSSANTGFGAIGYVVKPSPTSSSSTSISSDSTESLFGTLNICKPTAVPAIDLSKSANIFSAVAVGGSKAASEAPTNLFASVAASSGTIGSGFTSISKPSASMATTTTTTGSGLVSFGTSASTVGTTPSVFSVPPPTTNATSTSSTPTTFAQSTVTSTITTTTTSTPSNIKHTTQTTTLTSPIPNQTTTTTPTTIPTPSSATPPTSEVKSIFNQATLVKPAFTAPPATSNPTPLFTSLATNAFAPTSNANTLSAGASTTNLFAALSTSAKPAPNVNLFAASTATPTTTTTAIATGISSGGTGTSGAINLSGLSTAASTSTTAAVPKVQPVTVLAPISTLFGATTKAEVTSTITSSTAAGSTNIFGIPGATTATATSPATSTATSTAAGSSAFGASFAPPSANIFGSALAATATSSAATAAPTATAATPVPATNIFGAAISSAGPTAFTPTTRPALFGTSSQTPATTASSIFGAQPSSLAPPSGLFASAASGGSLFGAASGSAATATQPSTPLFAAGSSTAGAAGASIFGQPAAAATAPATAATGGSGGSIFASPSPASTQSASIFGGRTNTPGESIFSSPTQNQSFSGASIFGQSSPFAQSPTQSTTPAANIFGGAQQNQQSSSGGSIFGGGSSASSSWSPGGFTQPNTGSPFAPASGTTSGSFAQGGAASVGQTGFITPQWNTAKPVFGGAPTFGSGTQRFSAAPAFGGAATFGGGATFGSIFSGTQPGATSPTSTTSAFGTQKNNLFETLGSSESGLSFGNLAQSNAPQQQTPVFGGSKFMNYRA